MKNKIKYCPGCLRTFEEVSKEGCGSQRCPDFALISSEKLKKKVEEKKNFKNLLNSFAKANAMKIKKKTIYHVNVEVYGEQDFFFNEKGELLHYWDRNDANYRNEYMNPLFEKLGFIVKNVDWKDKRFYNQIIEELKSCGATDEDFK